MKTKMTTEKYKQKLLEKHIKIIPLEDYKGSREAILHKCICGKDSLLIPMNVLRGKKCGCGYKETNSNEYYLNLLKNENIKIIPLENYKGIKTKILHKCICGNEWNVRPNGVLNGNKCGCTPKGKQPENYDYIKKLKEKEIKVYPLEKYKGNKIKILHKCICGNEWKQEPNKILNDIKCGCGFIGSNNHHINNLRRS